MIDLAYIAGTVAFFALMIWYVRGLDLLGRRNPPGEKQ
jgi:hypothetical protein